MADRYVIGFSKSGYAKYTSHLDLLRFFKRAFRKSGIQLRYSQGFNPHPKLGFAQPLSLGYESCCELLEFETDKSYEPDEIYRLLKDEMPEGLCLQWCKRFDAQVKSLAAACESAGYQVIIPFDISEMDVDKLSADYLAQTEIRTMKRQKKDKKMVSVDIKDMIRRFEAHAEDGNLYLNLLLDCGSASNCSPELVIASFLEFSHIEVPRYDIEVKRESLSFYNNLQI